MVVPPHLLYSKNQSLFNKNTCLPYTVGISKIVEELINCVYPLSWILPNYFTRYKPCIVCISGGGCYLLS